MANLSVNDVFEGDTVLQKIIEELDTCFPPVNPTPECSHDLIMYRAGQRSVVEFLFSKLENEANV